MAARLAIPCAVVLGLVVLAGCGPDQGNQLVAPPAATATPLATERLQFSSATPKAKANKSPASGAFYKPPGWDGVSDVNCPDFDTHAHAQSFFWGTRGSKTNDPYGLDNDHDGLACETLP
jgi:hypothetical protein